MDEEEMDLNSPVGQLVTRLNNHCKKPKLDIELSRTLDLFIQHIYEAESYLENGICKINFVEAAMIIQSSAMLYAKKVDLLWDELLEYQTNMIKCDCEHRLEMGIAVNKEEIAKLEERRNRRKKTKLFNLQLKKKKKDLMPLLFDKEPAKKSEEVISVSYYHEPSYYWNMYTKKLNKIDEMSRAVYELQHQTYRFENYPIDKSLDEDLYDWEDPEEFIIKYSKLPGLHADRHLLEYNDLGLLPDRNNCLATVRLRRYGKRQFMFEMQISYEAPFESYKDRYELFKKKFFENEGKRWQNAVVLNTLQDLRDQFKYIRDWSQERERRKNVFLGRCKKRKVYNNKSYFRDLDECYLLENFDTVSDAINYVKKIENNGEDLKNSSKINNLYAELTRNFVPKNSFDPFDDNSKKFSKSVDDSKDSIDSLKDLSQTDLYVRLENLSNMDIDPKLRQDSGFYDGAEDSDYDSKDIAENLEDFCGNVNVEEVANNDINKNTTDGNKEGSSKTNYNDVEKNREGVIENNGDTLNEMVENGVEKNEEDYSANIKVSSEKTSYGMKQNKEVNTEVTKKNTLKNKEVLNQTTEEDGRPAFFSRTIIFPKVPKAIIAKNKLVTQKSKTDEESPTKRRKLSQKQIEKLLKGRVETVKEIKFEKFFSQNYNPSDGEGIMREVDYESEPEYNMDEPQHENEDDDSDIDNDQSETDNIHSAFDDSGYFESPDDLDITENSEEMSPVLTEKEIQEESELNRLQKHFSDVEIASFSPERRQEVLEIVSNLKDLDLENNKLISQEELKKEQQASNLRIQEWKDTIIPILKAVNSQQFDIRQYCENIMGSLEINETKKFEEILTGKGSGEAARYFVSSLQLANTGNVEICGAQPGRISNDTFALKLLSREKYYENLTDYQAPSEETYSKRLANAKVQKRCLKNPLSARPPSEEIPSNIIASNIGSTHNSKMSKLNYKRACKNKKSPTKHAEKIKIIKTGINAETSQTTYEKQNLLTKRSHSTPSSSTDFTMSMPSYFRPDLLENDSEDDIDIEPQRKKRRDTGEGLFVSTLEDIQVRNRHLSSPNIISNVNDV